MEEFLFIHSKNKELDGKEFKVLFYLLMEALKQQSDKADATLEQLNSATELSTNSLRNAIKGLIDKGFLIKKEKNIYQLTFIKSKKPEVIEGYRKATGTEKENSQSVTEADVKFQLGSVDKFYTPEISMMHLPNPNIYMNDKQLGTLARHICLNYFSAYCTKKKVNIGQQVNHLKDLLINYRTIQVVAGLYYWMKLSNKNVFSIGYLKFDGVMNTALLHFKVEALNPDSDYNVKKRLEQAVLFSKLQAEEAENRQKETERLAEMTEEQWLEQEFMAKFTKKGEK